jgi:hypothetical protein
VSDGTKGIGRGWVHGESFTPASALAQLSCGYRNSSDRMVIVRCIGPEEFFLERVVFPFELLSFLAPREAIVQIWTHGLGGPELVESLDVAELTMDMPAELELESIPASGDRHLEAVAEPNWGEAV